MSRISECLKEYKTPRKLICITALKFKDTTAIIKINNELLERLIVNTGVKQGDPTISAII
jgi:hypothetical protein